MSCNGNNAVILNGAIVSDLNFAKTKMGEEFSARFILAVNRNYKNKNGQIESDFFPIRINSKSRMEFAHMLKKGDKISLNGSLKTETYEKNEKKVFTLYVEADNISWLYPASSAKKQELEKTTEEDNDYANLPFS